VINTDLQHLSCTVYNLWLIICQIFTSDRGDRFTLTPSLGVIPCEYRYKWYTADSFGYISVAECVGVSSTTFTQWTLKATEFGEITQTTRPLCRSRSFKVTDFGTNRKPIMRLPISD